MVHIEAGEPPGDFPPVISPGELPPVHVTCREGLSCRVSIRVSDPGVNRQVTGWKNLISSSVLGGFQGKGGDHREKLPGGNHQRKSRGEFT